MAYVTQNVQGLAELERRLRGLPEKVDKRIFRKALMESAAIIGNQAKANFRARFKPHDLPHVPEGIISDMRIRGSFGGGSRIVVRLGLRIAPKTASVWYGRLLETGWNPESRVVRRAVARGLAGIRGDNIRRLAQRARRGRVREMVRLAVYKGALQSFSKEGQIPGRPFMEPAFKAKARAALDHVVHALRVGIEREAGKR